jgi:hypothetical protein
MVPTHVIAYFEPLYNGLAHGRSTRAPRAPAQTDCRKSPALRGTVRDRGDQAIFAGTGVSSDAGSRFGNRRSVSLLTTA